MPLVPPTRNPIDLPVAPRQFADTCIWQRATFQALTHTQAADGTCYATITVLVRMFAAEGAGAGPPLTASGFSDRSVQLVADNNCLVDARTGDILAVRRSGEGNALWQKRVEELSADRDTMLQGDFFEYLRDSGLPGTIREMIISYIQQADAAGKFA